MELRNLLLECDLNYPLDIFEICSKFSNLEIAAIPFVTRSLRGMAKLADTESSINCILVNSNLTQEEQNFHGMHELMHIYLPHDYSGTTFKCYDKVQPFQDSYVEWLANEGAAELIIPHDVLLPYIKENLYRFKERLFGICEMSEEIADHYRVSPVVVQNRFNSLKYEIYQYLNGCKISDIKVLSKTQQEKEGIFIESLNDIEDNRLLECMSKERTVATKTFFRYSESYRNLLIS